MPSTVSWCWRWKSRTSAVRSASNTSLAGASLRRAVQPLQALPQPAHLCAAHAGRQRLDRRAARPPQHHEVAQPVARQLADADLVRCRPDRACACSSSSAVSTTWWLAPPASLSSRIAGRLYRRSCPKEPRSVTHSSPCWRGLGARDRCRWAGTWRPTARTACRRRCRCRSRPWCSREQVRQARRAARGGGLRRAPHAGAAVASAAAAGGGCSARPRRACERAARDACAWLQGSRFHSADHGGRRAPRRSPRSAPRAASRARSAARTPRAAALRTSCAVTRWRSSE